MRLQLKWKFPRKCSTECFKRCSVRYFPRQARAKLLVEKANGIKGASLLDKTISMNHSRNPGTPIFYYLHMLLVKRVRTLAATLKWKHRVAWNLSQQISNFRPVESSNKPVLETLRCDVSETTVQDTRHRQEFTIFLHVMVTQIVDIRPSRYP